MKLTNESKITLTNSFLLLLFGVVVVLGQAFEKYLPVVILIFFVGLGYAALLDTAGQRARGGRGR